MGRIDIKQDKQEKTKKILDEFDNHDLSFKPKLIYHYTSCAALDGIIKSKKFWMSHFQSLNDREDVKHGIKFIRQELLKISSDYNLILPNDNYKKILIEHPVFIGSFSTKCDYLPQWRYYANNAEGVAIGLDLECLENKMSECFPGTECKIFSVSYSTTTRDKERLAKLINNINEYKKENIDRKTRNCFQEAYMNLLMAMACQMIKSLHYEHEYEYRIAVMDINLYEENSDARNYFSEQDIKKRYRNDFLNPIQYIDVLDIEGAIKEIWLGPKIKKFEENKQEIYELFKNNGYPDHSEIEIKQSIIPYQ